MQPFTALEHDLVVGSIDGRDARAEKQIHVVVRVPRPVMDEQSVEIGRPLQIRFGQRWALVRQLGFVTDQGDGAGMTLRA